MKSSITVKKYNQKYFNQWNKLVEISNNGTIFHSLEFLNYHKKKFIDQEHNLIFLKGEALFAVLPAVKIDNKLVSHFRASFGGIVTKKDVNLSESEQIVEALINYLIVHKFTSASLVLTPNHLCKSNNENLEYSLLRNGFNNIQSDLFNAINLTTSYKEIWDKRYLSRNRNTLRKVFNQFSLHSDCSLEEFYPILEQDKLRHQSQPTHSFDELEYLKRKFPQNIWFDIARMTTGNGSVGICYFRLNEKSLITFYMAQTDQALGMNGKNILIDFGIKKAIKNGYKVLDFGGSTVGYKIKNPGVAKFKESFGAKGALRKKYIWENTSSIF
tara:strand:- start:65 stop:1048 length:984 start_codon:yes stop_codon:yes gene_type:complete